MRLKNSFQALGTYTHIEIQCESEGAEKMQGVVYFPHKKVHTRMCVCLDLDTRTYGQIYTKIVGKMQVKSRV